MPPEEIQVQAQNKNFIANRPDIRVKCRMTPDQYEAVRGALWESFPSMKGTCQTVNAWQSGQFRIIPHGGNSLPDGLTRDIAEAAIMAAIDDNPAPLRGEQPWHMMYRRAHARRG